MGWGVTLNAVIAILATISKVALMYAISNAIGQLKWVWFSDNDSRQLFDAEVFDNASRGPQGALQMLVASTRKSIASIGAATTILALAFDPFVQQLVQHTSNLTYTTSAAAAISSFTLLNSTFVGNSTFSNQMFSAALWAFDLDGNASCPTGNCAWHQHQSLSFCTTCTYSRRTWKFDDNCSLSFADEDLLTSSPLNRSCALKSQDGFEVHTNISIAAWNSSSGNRKTDWTAAVWPSFNVTTTASLSRAVFTYTNSREKERWEQAGKPLTEKLFVTWEVLDNLALNASILECRVDFCIDTANRFVTNGTFGSGQIVKQLMHKSLRSYGPLKGCDYTTDYICYQPPSSDAVDISVLRAIPGGSKCGEDTVHVGVGEQDFVFCYPATQVINMLSLLSNHLDQKLSGWTYREDINGFESKQTNITYLGEVLVKRIRRAPSGDNKMSHENMQLLRQFNPERVMNDLARAWTRKMIDPNFNNGTRMIHGQAGQMETIVKVQWWWLTIPVFLCLSGIVFLALTIRASKKSTAPLWKSSVSALLFHGLDRDLAPHKSLATVREMERQATATHVRLAEKENKRQVLQTVITGRNGWQLNTLASSSQG